MMTCLNIIIVISDTCRSSGQTLSDIWTDFYLFFSFFLESHVCYQPSLIPVAQLNVFHVPTATALHVYRHQMVNMCSYCSRIVHHFTQISPLTETYYMHTPLWSKYRVHVYMCMQFKIKKKYILRIPLQDVMFISGVKLTKWSNSETELISSN